MNKPDIFLDGQSVRQYSDAMAAIVIDTSRELGVSEETARECVLASVRILTRGDNQGVQTIFNLHKRID
jgi:hypothetical protein